MTDTSQNRLGFLLVPAMLLAVGSSVAENIVSRPCGFIRIDVPATNHLLVSTPFTARDASINAVLGNQLTGAATEREADKVLKWDPVAVEYVKAVKADGTGDAEVDGKWLSDFSTLTESDMTLQPGDGFLIQNVQDQTQTVVLSGEVVLSLSNSLVLLPSLNLFGYPFATAVDIEDTQLWEQWRRGESEVVAARDEIIDPSAADATNVLMLGRAYWYVRNANRSLVWTEVRPYENIFPAGDGPPLIRQISVTEAGRRVTLEIECAGAAGERLAVYHQDLGPGTRFDARSGWQAAAVGIDPDGATQFEWADEGATDRPAPNQVFGRYYLVARTDIDADADGIADALALLAPVGDADGSAGGDVAPDDGIASVPGQDVTSEHMSDLAASNRVVRVPELTWGRIVYVDRLAGSDAYAGRSALRTERLRRDGGQITVDGPKQTIRAGLAEAREGDTLVIKPGAYAEDLNIAGRRISVRIHGHVNLSGKGRAGSPPHQSKHGAGQALPAEIPIM